MPTVALRPGVVRFVRAFVRGCAPIVLAVAGTACTLMPAYERPPFPAAMLYPTQTGSVPEAEASAAELGWRTAFSDPRLKRLIELALANNRDLRVSVLNIEASRALYRIQSAELYPAIGLGADYSVQRSAASLGVGGGGGQGQTLRTSSISVGITSFELDFFGRIRSLKEQALQNFFATEEARRAAHISLVGEVALDYLALAADQERLALARQTFESQSASYELSRRTFEVGTVSALTLRQQQTSVDTARVDIARYTSAVAQDVNRLVLVVGAPLPDDTVAPAGLDDAMAAPADLPAGLPSDLLVRRPDILQAEHTLRGLNANIGAARAAFFPRISLTGSAGRASASLGGLFKAGSGNWAIGPSLSLPLFDGGANRAALEVAQVDRDVGVAQYERAIQVAFREVADALVQRANLGDELAAQRSLVEATQDTYRLSQARFRSGVDSYLQVLDSQRSLYAAQQGLINSRLSNLENLTTLYKVLGGGWLQ